MTHCHRLCAITIAVAIAASATAQEAVFRGLGDLPGGLTQSVATDVSNGGIVVVGSSSSSATPDGREAFRWTEATGMVGLGDFPGGLAWSDGDAVSSDGSTVVGRGFTSADQQAFRWTASEGMQSLGTLPHPPGSDHSWAFGVSANGTVVSGESVSTDGDTEAFRWVQGSGMVGIGDLPGGFLDSHGMDISDDGSVIVGSGRNADGDLEAFRWQNGTMTALGELPEGSAHGQAEGVSANGLVAVGWSSATNNRDHAFRWSGATGMVDIHPSTGEWLSSIARSTSADGSIVVGHGNRPVGGGRAWIWTAETGMRDLRQVLINDYGLDVTGWILVNALGISPDGTAIVGGGINPAGESEAWLVVLPSDQCVEPLAIRSWNDPLGGPFADPSNWSAGGVPGATDQALFELSDGSDYTVSFVGSHTNDALLLRNGNHVRFDLAGQTYTATGQSGCGSSLDVRDILSSPRLEIANGTVLALGAELSGPVGTELALLGGGRLTVAGGLLAGEFAGDDVSVLVESGGRLTATGTGQVTFGGMGRSEVNVEGGGEASFGVPLRIADATSGLGTLRATGINARLNLLGPAVVGYGGSGILSAHDAGVIDARDVVLGRLAGSDGTLHVFTNGHVVTQNLDVGLDGHGEVTVSGLGALEVRRTLSIPRGPGNGVVTVEDGGIVAETIRLGVYGEGTLVAHGFVEAGQFIHAIDGTLLPEGACVRIGGAACPTTLDGTIGTLAADTVWVAPGATLGGANVVLGDGGVLGGGGTLALDFTNAGAVNPGDSAGVAGTFTIGGAYTQAPAGALEIELGGSAAGAYDRLAVAGAATLDGVLRFSHLADFTPAPGDMFDVLTAASVTGAFAGVEGPPGCTYSLAYGPTSVTATVLTVATETPAGAPALVLHPPAPNPATGQTTLRYELPAAGAVRLAVYDALGREVAVLVDAEQPAGAHAVRLNAAEFAPGVYVVRFAVGAGAATRTLSITR